MFQLLKKLASPVLFSGAILVSVPGLLSAEKQYKNIGEEYYAKSVALKIERVGNFNIPSGLGSAHRGKVIARIHINRDGSLKKVELAQSTGDPVVDNAAINAVKRSAPFSPVPSNVFPGSETVIVTRTMILGP